MTSNPKQLMDLHALAPKKGLGQNFLHDPNTLRKIIDTANIRPGDTVLEIGPGTGALTQQMALLHPDATIIAIEIDQRLRPILEREVGDAPNVRVIYDDFLRLNVNALMGDADYMVVANVPYYISSAILKRLLQDVNVRPTRLVMTVQYELAERICAEPGDMSLLAVSVQYYGQPHLVSKISNGVFWPRPDVSSAILRIDTFPAPSVEPLDEKLFFRVVRAGFSQKRKQLKNSISGGLHLKPKVAVALLEEAGVDPKRRAETLTMDEWGELAVVYSDHIGALGVSGH
jgi:16S rRNA (adenine1518-N6/adenine1519-N6)-dimethyltransferase